MQNQFIKIESKGIIEPQAFVLLGASTKRADDTKIGFFGSGLKYSIAYLLRNKIEFKVYADYKEVLFSTQKELFRDREWDVIYINNEKTSMTTEMGIDWESWFVLREIYCNAIDEGDSSISIVDECVPYEDKTVFYIKITEDFKKIIAEWDLYFSEKREDLVYSDANANQIYAGGDRLLVYRKGIRCLYSKDIKTIFNYDLNWVVINESRVIKNEWDFKYELRKFLQQVKDKKVIAQILNTVNSSWEKGLSWDCGSSYYSESWVEVIGRKVLVPYENAGFWQEVIQDSPEIYLILPSNMVEGLKARFLDAIKVIGDTDIVKCGGSFKPVESIGKKETQLLQDSIDFLKKANYDVKYPITVVDFVKPEQLGQALDGTILLSSKLFESGRKNIVAVIIEEQEHLITKFEDETRSFQTHFINKYVTALEELTGIYL